LTKGGYLEYEKRFREIDAEQISTISEAREFLISKTQKLEKEARLNERGPLWREINSNLKRTENNNRLSLLWMRFY